MTISFTLPSACVADMEKPRVRCTAPACPWNPRVDQVPTPPTLALPHWADGHSLWRGIWGSRHSSLQVCTVGGCWLHKSSLSHSVWEQMVLGLVTCQPQYPRCHPETLGARSLTVCRRSCVSLHPEHCGRDSLVAVGVTCIRPFILQGPLESRTLLWVCEDKEGNVTAASASERGGT